MYFHLLMISLCNSLLRKPLPRARDTPPIPRPFTSPPLPYPIDAVSSHVSLLWPSAHRHCNRSDMLIVTLKLCWMLPIMSGSVKFFSFFSSEGNFVSNCIEISKYHLLTICCFPKRVGSALHMLHRTVFLFLLVLSNIFLCTMKLYHHFSKEVLI